MWETSIFNEDRSKFDSFNRDPDTHMEFRTEEISHLRELAHWERELVEDEIDRSEHEPLEEEQ